MAGGHRLHAHDESESLTFQLLNCLPGQARKARIAGTHYHNRVTVTGLLLDSGGYIPRPRDLNRIPASGTDALDQHRG